MVIRNEVRSLETTERDAVPRNFGAPPMSLLARFT